ncbi:glutaredoxin family protein [Dehalogenimonas etheniformans]|uniref:Glutaredoxin family protein n=1 Tax=Dehalogenimonas etheniformans TaxID=1536648 RepID=A0A2P5P9Y6_9CHLR|nr:glutaredoxin family protein [Dehalogenimonas etheniformans]PPD59126.1 glutaredoxin family protein [Dehalogenimonas etheniformans]QNT75831.1 glutaredoxin family protein [Dehalogenimonas etheniformans]
MARVTVPGVDKGNVMLFALSTCVWCGKTKKLLEEMGVAYTYEYVDLLSGKDRDAAVKEIMVWNPATSFPTLVINNEKCIVGFKEDEIRRALA